MDGDSFVIRARKKKLYQSRRLVSISQKQMLHTCESADQLRERTHMA